MDGDCAKTAREVTSQRIVKHAAKLAGIAEKIAATAEGRLTPIVAQCPKVTEGIEGKTLSQYYPPLFDELRGYFNTIERSLNSISSTIDRVELP